MVNLEKRNCACGKEFEVSKFAPKTTACQECAIIKLAAKRKEKKMLNKIVKPEDVPEGPDEYEPGAEGVTQDELDSDPFSIIAVYNLFGKEAIYVWLLLREFKVSGSGTLFKQFGNIYVFALLKDSVKFIVSLLDKPNSAIMVESIEDIEELPDNIVSDLLPIASLVWPKGQGGKK